MQTFYTKSTAETEALAEGLASSLDACVIAMTGDLGAGKTAFTRGLARGLGFCGEVSSPTFAIVHEYVGGRLPLYHFDMYRISGWEDLYSCGYFDYIERDCILSVEWSENITAALPEDCITVDIRKGEGENERIITVGGIDLENIGS